MLELPLLISSVFWEFYQMSLWPVNSELFVWHHWNTSCPRSFQGNFTDNRLVFLTPDIILSLLGSVYQFQGLKSLAKGHNFLLIRLEQIKIKHQGISFLRKTYSCCPFCSTSESAAEGALRSHRPPPPARSRHHPLCPEYQDASQ